MFDISWPELILIAVVALVFFGPNRLPDVARSLGRSIKAFKEGLKEGLDDETPKASPPQITAEKPKDTTPVG